MNIKWKLEMFKLPKFKFNGLCVCNISFVAGDKLNMSRMYTGNHLELLTLLVTNMKGSIEGFL
jgi:hypothetical protein